MTVSIRQYRLHVIGSNFIVSLNGYENASTIYYKPKRQKYITATQRVLVLSYIVQSRCGHKCIWRCTEYKKYECTVLHAIQLIFIKKY